MRRMIRFAALVPMLAFAAACSGAGAPTGTGQLTSSDPYEAVSGEATQMGKPGCRDIASVQVGIVPGGMDVVKLRARYVYKEVTSFCAVPPNWAATRSGLNVSFEDPFRASISRRTDLRTTVTATAPNGKAGSVTF